MLSPEIIVINGKPGAGKSHLGHEFETFVGPHMATYLSVPDHMRKIARGEYDSSYYEELVADGPVLTEPKIVRPEVFYGVFEEFVTHNDSNLLLLDGLPRYPERIDDFYASASLVGANVVATCLIDVPDEIAVKRMVERKPKVPDMPITPEYAAKRIREFHEKAAPTHTILAETNPSLLLSGLDDAEKNCRWLLDFYRDAIRHL